MSDVMEISAEVEGFKDENGVLIEKPKYIDRAYLNKLTIPELCKLLKSKKLPWSRFETKPNLIQKMINHIRRHPIEVPSDN